MKKLFFAFAAALIALTACKKENAIKTVTLTVTVDESELTSVKPDTYTVTATNSATTVAVSAKTENGIATIPGLVPGIYNLNVAASVSEGPAILNFIGTAQSVQVTADASATVKVAESKTSALVFKEVYYNGCTIVEPSEEDEYGETYFRDQFYEIYNNSTETVYADGLCIAVGLWQSYASYDFSVIYTYDIPNPEKYIFLKTIWQIPGDGTQYPVKPGESFVVCQWGTNHTAETLAGNKSIDLSGAEFEAIIAETTLWNGLVITDNAAVNMSRVVETGYAMPQWMASVGDDAVVLFNPSVELKNENFISCTNDEYGPDVREVLRSDILDAVQWRTNKEDGEKAGGLYLPAEIDGGFQALGASYTGKSISRKAASTREDGTVVYQDTNNASVDFQINDKPEVRRGGAKKPSWNTWAK
ncbi:MAG: DUF4876 domain-containing protein [Bacteroidales bacterium]|nr:DUF4876 domain-containing protein [Bacteroidales bacterium]